MIDRKPGLLCAVVGGVFGGRSVTGPDATNQSRSLQQWQEVG